VDCRHAGSQIVALAPCEARPRQQIVAKPSEQNAAKPSEQNAAKPSEQNSAKPSEQNVAHQPVATSLGRYACCLQTAVMAALVVRRVAVGLSSEHPTFWRQRWMP
jgi:hypothetical protein